MGALFLAITFFTSRDLLCSTTHSTPGGTFGLMGDSSPALTKFLHALADCEEKFQGLTGYPSSDSPPILVVLHSSEESHFPKNTLRVDSLEGKCAKIQIDLAISQSAGSELGDILSRGMLLREFYANGPLSSGATVMEFPLWLTRGIGWICRPWGSFAPSPSFLNKGKMVPFLKDFLHQQPSRAGSNQVLEAYDWMAAAIVKAGMKGGGASDFRKWIGHFNPRDPARRLSDWPEGWLFRPIERRWLLIMAGDGSGATGGGSMLGTVATIKRYDAIISELSTPGHSLTLLKKEKGYKFTSQQLTSRLRALRLQANPLVMPLIDSSLHLLSVIEHQSFKKLTLEEKQITNLRNLILKQSHSIEDYLDWYEMTKAPGSSGLFDRYLVTPEMPVKKGPVGRYLDAIEERGW